MIEAASEDASGLSRLEDAFCRDLPIGTGGRRGEVGAGPNRINSVVLTQTALGVAAFIREGGRAAKVVVAHDTRRDSSSFARMVSRVLASQGLEVRLLDEPRATPQLSFEVRDWGAGAGVVISASHNPPGDNGIKIYGDDGAQVLGANDRALMAAIQAVDLDTLGALDLEGELSGSIEALSGESLASRDAVYQAYVNGQGIEGLALDQGGLRIVYTPLHGVGHHVFLPLLKARGAQVHPVEAQLDPDNGRFSTVESANPESPAAFDMARALADEVGADLVLANDPDADRLGALLRNAEGELIFIDGNRIGALMMDHLLRQFPEPSGMVMTTLVTSPLLSKMAQSAGLDTIDDLLVGFKHHAGVVAEHPGVPLFFACEESHGYVRGNEIRDKDGLIAGLLLAEAAADAAGKGGRLHDRLAEIWTRHGYHREKTKSVWARGAAGREAIAAVMKAMRREAPAQLGGLSLQARADRLDARDTGSATRDLSGNVLVFEYAGEDGGCRVVLRPSGTEPKLKIYALAHGKPGEASPEGQAAIDAVIDAVLADAQAAAEGIMEPFMGSGA
jgi:phosphomannomutase